ncbi:MAG TPA: lamin tail domain-containing protein [Bacteroidales bacterium]|nr:lamin tail domain-containing protein [Bacteroidales bacterium]
MKIPVERIHWLIPFLIFLIFLPAVVTAQKVVINEIMYHPSEELGADSVFEYIELYNSDTAGFDLSGWSFTEGISYVFPQGISLGKEEYLVIARNPDSVMTHYGIENVYGPFSDSLANAGEEIELSNNEDDVIDYMMYGNEGDWPTEPNGKGPSLELIDPVMENTEPESWDASIVDGGTPGILNSVAYHEPSIVVTSPNGGEFWEQGEEYPITWTSVGMEGAVRIELYKDGLPFGVLSDSTDNSGSWTWAIPVGQPAGIHYRIRISDEADDDPADVSDTDFAIIMPTEVPNVVITEIMYNPPQGETDNIEFIEIFNNFSAPVNMEDSYFSKGIDYLFPDTVLSPGAYIVIARNAVEFESIFGFTPFQWTGGELGDDGDTIQIRNPLNIIIDMVPYTDELPWDTLADGYGHSLTFCDAYQDNSDPEFWMASADLAVITPDGDTIYATPGGACGSMAPVADFEADTTTIYQGEGVNFTDLSANNPTYWYWTFPGTLQGWSTEQNPGPIIYETPGLYDVKLIAYNINGTDTLTREDYIEVLFIDNTPHANFTVSDTMIYVGSAVDFTDLTANEPTAWEWHFPGGEPSFSNDQNPQGILYSAPGLYDVQLFVTNEFGEDLMIRNDYIAVFDTIPAGLVITEIMYNPPETGTDSLEFIEIYNNGASPVVLKGLHFSEGIDYTFPGMVLSSNEYQVVAANSESLFNTFGVASLQWAEGALSNSGEDIELSDFFGTVVDYLEYDDEAPWPLEPDGGGPSLTLCDPDADNSLPENWQASIEFAAVNAAGDTIRATPGRGCATPPTADFTSDFIAIAPGDSISFFDLSTGQPEEWHWSFVGGTPESSNGQNPQDILYTTAGIYTVSLSVFNDYGADSLTRYGYITVGFAPQADFVVDETEIATGAQVTFTDLSQGFPLSVYFWTFPGGVPDTSDEQNPVVTYPDAGDFDVTLTVTNVFGESAELKTEYIHVTVGVGDIGEDDMVSVYPDPSDGCVRIQSPVVPLEVEVISILGEKVFGGTLTEPVSDLDLQGLRKGIYFLVFHSGNDRPLQPVKLMIY